MEQKKENAMETASTVSFLGYGLIWKVRWRFKARGYVGLLYGL